MAQPKTAVCAAWATQGDLYDPCDYGVDASLADTMLDVASNVLFHLSGRQFPGICSDVVRPNRLCKCNCWDSFDRGYRSWRGCGHTVSEIALPGHPIARVTQVKIDGAVIDPVTYRVDNYNRLVRVSSATERRTWPCSQRMDLPSTETDTFEVSFDYGVEPPIEGVHAASVLACQLMLASTPDSSKCKLPTRVQSITRQGITMAMLDPFDFLEQGKTGLYEVDLFLKVHNPNGLRRRARVISPDIQSAGRRAGT